MWWTRCSSTLMTLNKNICLIKMRTRRNKKQSRQVGKGLRGTFGFGRSSRNWCVEKDLSTEITQFIQKLLKDEQEKNGYLFARNMSDTEYVDRLTRKVYNSNYFRTTSGQCRNSRRPNMVTKNGEHMQTAIREIIKETASKMNPQFQLATSNFI